MESSLLPLLALGLALGLRHGIDWDHIAAISDIAGSAVGTRESHVQRESRATGLRWPGHHHEAQLGFRLATWYALGHATLVVLLGIGAIWVGSVLPEWIDPFMERVVGLTLVLLGAWILYSVLRHGHEFRLQSRWMLVFSLASQAWDRLQSRVTGRPRSPRPAINRYGPKTAYGIGMLHGVGAETGSQALLLASAAGATTALSGSVLLLAFTVGLVLSNSLVAALSAFGFLSALTKRKLYLAIGVLAGIFSVVIGVLFLTGQGALLPDVQLLLDQILGTEPLE